VAPGAAAAGTLLARNARAGGVSRRPNIVLIVADDLGYGHLGCYGQRLIHTPVLDKMASEGVQFRQFYSGSTVCAPSRCVLMTSRHTGHCTIRTNSGGVSLLKSEITLGNVVRSAGYRTGAYGKWGLGDACSDGTPDQHGFDEFFGYLHQAHAHSYYPEYLWRNRERVPLPGNRDGAQKQYSHDVIFQEALRFVRDNARRPFFLYLPVTIPHADLVVPEDSLAEYRGRFPETPYAGDPAAHRPPIPAPRATFAGMVTRMDRCIGQLLALLRALNLEQDTLVMFTSDNGPAGPDTAADPEFFNGAGGLRGIKRDLYEGGIRVPMIARWPGVITPRVDAASVWTFCDMLPTLAELVKATPPGDIDGASALSAVVGNAPLKGPLHEFLYWEFRTVQAVRMGVWKGLRKGPGRPLEVYNLDLDPTESNNVASAQPRVVEAIERYLKTARVAPPPQVEPCATPGKPYA
jgi:arylsulfatase A-like enzyme